MSSPDVDNFKPENNSTASPMLYRIVIAFSIFLLLFIIWLVFIAANTAPDETIFDFFSAKTTFSRSTIMRAITFLGNHSFLIPANLLLMIYFIIRGKKWETVYVFFVAISSLGIMSLLKTLFHRHRPLHPLVEGITNYSFPSGHAFMSVAFFGLFIFFTIQKVKNIGLQYLLISLLLFLLFMIGLSRVYLRVHYATDVLAGWILGSLWLFICFELLAGIKRKKSVHETQAPISYK